MVGGIPIAIEQYAKKNIIICIIVVIIIYEGVGILMAS